LEPERVSPELVLVDPELAERELARLTEKARLAELVDTAALRRAVKDEIGPAEPALLGTRRRTATDYSRRRLLPAALMGSLLANGFLVADRVTPEGQESSAGVPVVVRLVTVTQGLSGEIASTAPSTPSRSHRVRSQPARHLVATKASVEQKLFSLILAAPARKLPRAFVDPKTGLVRNNVHVVCRRTKKRSFLCAIRRPTNDARQGLFVRYRPGLEGKGVFNWYGYRSR
jgi:hypothetical protein